MAALSFTRRSTQIAALSQGPAFDTSGVGGTPGSANVQTGTGGAVTGVLAGVASGFVKRLIGFVTINPAVDLTTTATIYNLVRLRSNAALHAIRLMVDKNLDTSTTTVLAWNVAASYSDAPAGPSVSGTTYPPVLDGSLVANAGNQVTSATDTTGTSSFASGIKFGGGANTNSLTNDYLLPAVNSLNSLGIASARVQPLWQALGLASDPGGYIDINMKVSALPTVTQASTTAGLLMQVDFM